MTDRTAIVHAEPESTAVQREAGTMLDVIARAARDPAIDVAKLERLLAIQERLLADQRRTSYMAALARLQERLPQIAKSGRIMDRDGATVRNRYAKIEDIDTVVRPLCAAEGFSFSYDSKAGPGGAEYACAMHHRDGHTEVKTITLQSDTSGSKNAVQAMGSTVSYARRYLLGMHLNLITRDEDDDGAGGGGAVTAEQAAELRAALAEAGGSEDRFLRWAGAATFEEIPAARYQPAVKFLEEKMRKAKGGGQ